MEEVKSQTTRLEGEALFARLLADASGEIWLKQGAFLLEWLEQLSAEPGEQALEALAVELESYNQKAGCAVSWLLEADVLLRMATPPQSRVVSLLQDALADEVWTRQPTWLALWCHHLGAGLGFLLGVARAADDFDMIERWRQRALEIPWERAAQSLTPHWLHQLCVALSRVEAWSGVERLIERIGKKFPEWSELVLWRGWCMAQRGQHREALGLIEKGLALVQGDALDAQMWCALTEYCAGQEDTDAGLQLAEQCLLQVRDRDTSAFQRAALSYCLALGAWAEAYQLSCECEIADDGLLAHRVLQVGLLIALHRFAEAETLLESVLDQQIDGQTGEQTADQVDDSSDDWGWLQLLRARLWLSTAQQAPALALFRRYWPQLRRAPGHIWFIPSRTRELLVAFGDGFRQIQEDGEALQCYMQALQLSPTPGLFLRACALLSKHRQWEDAQTLMAHGVQLFPEQQTLRYGAFLNQIQMEHWEQAEGLLASIGGDWFAAHDLEREWLLGKVQIAMGQGDVLAAFLACETMLETVLQDEELRSLRAELVSQLQAQFQDMLAQLGEHRAQTQRSSQLQAQLASVMARHHQQQSAFAQMNAAHEALQREIEALRHGHPSVDLRAPLELLQAQYPDLSGTISKESRHLLASALFLWDKLQQSAQSVAHDYGPVILQLARACEAEVNRMWIDPLVDFVLSNGGGLGVFPLTSMGALAPKGNHLSLGDAARLLYHRIESTESDGSVTVVRNPHTNPQHAQWLDRWWRSLQAEDGAEGAALEHELPRLLQALAGLRNQAGHAGAALTQAQAARALLLVFGDRRHTGLLTISCLAVDVAR